jgi:hypothetical protein
VTNDVKKESTITMLIIKYLLILLSSLKRWF